MSLAARLLFGNKQNQFHMDTHRNWIRPDRCSHQVHKKKRKHHSPNTMFSHGKSNPFLFWPNFAPILNTNEYRKKKSAHFKHIEHDLLCECVRFYFRRVLAKKIQ